MKKRGQSEARATKRANKLGRSFNNKSGAQVVITKFFKKENTFGVGFSKSVKRFQRLNGKTIVHHDITTV